MKFLKASIIIVAIAASLYLIGLIWGDSKLIFETIFLEKSDIFENSNLTVEGIVAATNRERASFGIDSLIENEKLSLAAEIKLDNMFKYQYFDHLSPSGKEVDDLVALINYDFIAVGENLASGNFSDDKDLVASWMNSPGHRENILNFRYMEIGAAARKGDFKGQKVWVAVQIFALPSRACPEIDKNLLVTISSNQKRLAEINKELNQLQFEIESIVPRDSEAVLKHNAWVYQYNIISGETQKMIREYNSQVELTNECIASYGF